MLSGKRLNCCSMRVREVIGYCNLCFFIWKILSNFALVFSSLSLKVPWDLQGKLTKHIWWGMQMSHFLLVGGSRLCSAFSILFQLFCRILKKKKEKKMERERKRGKSMTSGLTNSYKYLANNYSVNHYCILWEQWHVFGGFINQSALNVQAWLLLWTLCTFLASLNIFLFSLLLLLFYLLMGPDMVSM